MVDLLQTALAALPKLIPRRKVGYQRGDEQIWIDATVGRTALYYVDESGVRQFGEIRDYLIVPAELAFHGVEVEPEEDDLIIDTEDGNRIFHIMADSGEVWRYTDRYRTMYRIHTKGSDEV